MLYFYLASLMAAVAFLAQCFISEKRKAGLFFLLVSFLAVVISRVPSILYPQSLCIDEAEWLALASRLQNCNIPYKCYNASTSGFLSILVLQVFGWFGGALNYSNLRVFGLLLCGLVSVYFYFHTLKILYGEKWARIFTSVLFLYLVLGFHDREFLAYNTEYLILVFTSILFYLYIRLKTAKEHSMATMFFIGLIIGVLPFFKLQAVPIAFAFFLLTGWYLWTHQSKKHVIGFFGISAFPLLVFLLFFAAMGVLEDFYYMYIKSNIYYISHRITSYQYSDSEFIHKLRAFKGMQEYFYPVYGSLILFALGMAIAQRSLRWRKLPWDFILIWGLAAYSTYNTGNGFGHYNVLLIVPCFFICADMVITIWNYKPVDKNALVAIVIISILPWSAYITKAEKPIYEYGVLSDPIELAAVNYVRNGTNSKEPVCTLGWSRALEFQLRLDRSIATRNATEQYISIEDEGLKAYFQKQYISDLTIARPRFIVDSEKVLHRPEILRIKNFVVAQYRKDTTIGEHEIYRIREEIK